MFRDLMGCGIAGAIKISLLVERDLQRGTYNF
jgi:hypothetical protein